MKPFNLDLWAQYLDAHSHNISRNRAEYRTDRHDYKTPYEMRTEWHKVSDKLPPIDKDVLVWIKDMDCHDIGCINERGEWETNLHIWDNITHWVELPEPPK